ncbi:hypothetical protein PALB_17490 [Pseudoalteromonas luteoviolacea B = ATCC 29581]|nr:hypothetical protein PALB_17490 [Pseudoalteromonas luteoviolacea B = ATCC 29581]
MPFSEFELKRIEMILDKALEKRRPHAHSRHEFDIRFRIDKQSVFIFERRQDWRDKSHYNEIDTAKLTFVKSQNVWKIYWMRQDLKWHSYQPNPTATRLEAAIETIIVDEYGCFWG